MIDTFLQKIAPLLYEVNYFCLNERVDNYEEILLASSANGIGELAGFPPVAIDNSIYVDGGFTDNIPISLCMRMKNVGTYLKYI